eukprot:m.280905 g.280905  ORF g.280905 m.280905 type:complete len:53 (+) comp15751_c2_seq1:588-746(+)
MGYMERPTIQVTVVTIASAQFLSSSMLSNQNYTHARTHTYIYALDSTSICIQ